MIYNFLQQLKNYADLASITEPVHA